LASAIAESTEVELNESKDSVRRLGNKPIPTKEMTPAEVAENAEKEAKDAEKKELANYYEAF
jgi:hypothetical protein